MKITITSTSKVVELVTDRGSVVPARVWEGQTDGGVPVHCFITRIAPTIPRDDPRQEQFVSELKECEAPSADVVSYPLRMIL